MLSNKERTKKYQTLNKEKFYQNMTKYRKNLRVTVLAMLGNKCMKCKFPDSRALQIDHINGGGNKKETSRGAHYWNKVIKSITDGKSEYQLLCANCNWIKRVENKECTGRPRKL